MMNIIYQFMAWLNTAAKLSYEEMMFIELNKPV